VDASVIWRASDDPVPASPDAQCSRRDARIVVKELRADANWLYIDVSHEAASPDTRHDGESAELLLVADGCPKPPRRVSGSVWRDWADPSTLVTSLSELPDGDLSLTVHAFGAGNSFLINKRGRRVRRITFEEQAGDVDIPAQAGLPAGFTVNRLRECEGESEP
jgi:hypothetical protein